MRIQSEGGLGISLRESLPEAELLGADDLCVTACSRDSRCVRPGDLFAAWCGTVHDGHRFAADAVRRGAKAVLAQRAMPGIGVPLCRVPNAREAYARLCQALAGNPSDRLCVVGVTGTNGKTTTSCLIASVLTAAGYRTGLLGTLGGFDGFDFHGSSLTTPPPEEIAGWLARCVANGCSHAVLEVSSHALDQSRIAGIALDAACVTNVRRDHLDYHRSIADYRMTKSRLLDHLSGQGFAVLNADDSTSASYLARLANPVLTVGMCPGLGAPAGSVSAASVSAAEIWATVIERFPSEQTFLLTAGSETVPVRTRMIGGHHVSNCLMAAAVGLAYGIDLMTVVKGLEAVEHVPGRLERIECGQPFAVFVDYAHTPDALTGSLRTLREVVAGRLICVFGAGGDRDRQKRPLMARAVEEEADLAIVTTDNPRTEDPLSIQRDLLLGFQRPDAAELIPDRAAAIRWALEQAQSGDCVLIAGKGHERHQIIGTERIPFDDREVARAWLYEVQPAGV